MKVLPNTRVLWSATRRVMDGFTTYALPSAAGAFFLGNGNPLRMLLIFVTLCLIIVSLWLLCCVLMTKFMMGSPIKRAKFLNASDEQKGKFIAEIWFQSLD